MQEWKDALKEVFPQVEMLFDEPMKNHTTFRIGGPADVYISPRVEEAKDLIAYCEKHDIPVTILGNGSNVLVSDAGIQGVVLSFGKNAAEISVSGNQITAQAGALLSQVANEAANRSLSGLEFAAGIPGTIGGAVLMNAGAYGGEMKDVIVEISVLLPNGNVEVWQKDALGLAYRHSRMMEEGGIVLDATFELSEKPEEEIRAVMQDFRGRRQEKQPLEYPSAGSTFKRPEGYFAGKLIMDAGLRGYAVGDACVSEKHCGFVVNKGNASAADVCKLMDEVSEKVMSEFGVALEPEVRLIGDFS